MLAVGAYVVTRVVPASSSNPFAGKQLYVNPDSQAKKAEASDSAADAAIIAPLGDTPSAIWLLPETYGTSQIGTYLDSVTSAAEKQGEYPVFVIYGVPDRDCSGQSAGGLTASTYPGWISAIANALKGHPAAVMLEPDSLALADQCPDPTARIAQIKSAVATLTSTDGSDIALYLDGGHSNWHPAATQANLLNEAGVSSARGFFSNVANFNPTANEVAYDNQVSSLTGGAHYVIDTSRNGSGSDGQTCNPPGRTIGQAPTVFNGTAEDAVLWIKNPGESDGSCNGGPPAGEWFPSYAAALMGH